MRLSESAGAVTLGPIIGGTEYRLKKFRIRREGLSLP